MIASLGRGQGEEGGEEARKGLQLEVQEKMAKRHRVIPEQL